MWHFARRPRWILSHLAVLALIVAMVNLGFWQLRRLDERTAQNDVVKARAKEPVAAVTDLVARDQIASEAKAASQWRRATASGSYDVSREVVVSNRTRGGDPGFWVLTPLVLADGSLLPVARGFLYRGEFATSGLGRVSAPTGPVEIEGVLQASPSGGLFGEERWKGGRITAVSQVDTAKLESRWGDGVLPLWLRLDAGAGAPTEQGPLVPIPEPVLSRGPHFGYAMQWFIFSLIAVIGYPMILVRRSRESDSPAAPDSGTMVAQPLGGK